MKAELELRVSNNQFMATMQNANRGDAEAQFTMALYQLSDEGLKDTMLAHQQAFFWLEQAAAQGHTEAKKTLESLKFSKGQEDETKGFANKPFIDLSTKSMEAASAYSNAFNTKSMDVVSAYSNPLAAFSMESAPSNTNAQKLPITTVSSQGNKAKLSILSIDGGGIRGLIPAIVLDRIESKLSERFKELDIRIADFFDRVAGTSTGSIISLGLLVPSEFDKYRPRYKASKLVELYKIKGTEIFPQDPWRELTALFTRKYPAEALDSLLKEYFQTLKIDQTVQQKPIFVPSYNISHNKEFFFENTDERKDYEMREVVRASSAAPTYLPAMEIRGENFIDGGVFMNHPALGAYVRAKEMFPELTNCFILSLGTGEDDQELPESSLKNAGQLFGKGGIGWAKHAPTLMMKGTSGATEHMMRMLAASDKSISYHRLQATLKEAVLDKVDEKTLKELEEAAEKIIESPGFKKVYEELEKVCGETVKKLKDRLSSSDNSSVDLQGFNISVQFASNLHEKLTGSSTITRLNLARCGIDSESLKKLIEGLKWNKVLTELDLSQNGVGFTGVAYLGQLLRKNTSLKTLSLKENGVDDRAMKELGSLIKRKDQPTSLTYLDLSCNKIGNLGLEHIFQAFDTLKISPLQLINLKRNKIGEMYRNKYVNLTGDKGKDAINQLELKKLGEFLKDFSIKFPEVIVKLKHNDFPEFVKTVFKEHKPFNL